LAASKAMPRHPFTQTSLAACLAVIVVMGSAYIVGAHSALASTLGLIASTTTIVLALGWTQRDALRTPTPRRARRGTSLHA
jgi:hypothetical protein